MPWLGQIPSFVEKKVEGSPVPDDGDGDGDKDNNKDNENTFREHLERAVPKRNSKDF